MDTQYSLRMPYDPDTSGYEGKMYALGKDAWEEVIEIAGPVTDDLVLSVFTGKISASDAAMVLILNTPRRGKSKLSWANSIEWSAPLASVKK